MVKLILLFILSTSAQALEVVALQEATIEYQKYLPGARVPLITGNGLDNRKVEDGLSLKVNADLFQYFYWNNRMHATTDSTNGGGSRFRAVGYEFFIGFRPISMVEIEYRHHSQHLLDSSGLYPYPLEDAVQIRVVLFRKDDKNGLLDFLVDDSSKSTSHHNSGNLP